MPTMRLSLALLLVLGAPVAADPACRDTEFEGTSYTLCSFRADQDDLRLFHTDKAGQLYGHFFAIDRALADQDKTLVFAMNGGMYHDDRDPVGLYRENGVDSAPLVTRDGPGNFGLLPNGVFCLETGGARVIESRRFAREQPTCQYATQSGPMLVIDGTLHPRFLEDSSSKHIRNGVGVSPDGATVHFAISNGRVNFHSFGRFFRDVLGTPNALYFDGKVSRLYAPEIGRSDAGFALGPIVGVVAPKED